MLLLFISLFDLYFAAVVHFVVVLHFVNVLHSHFLFDIISHPFVDYRRIFTPILYFQNSPLQIDLQLFHFQPFRYLLTASAAVLSGQFLPTDVFLPDASSEVDSGLVKLFVMTNVFFNNQETRN